MEERKYSADRIALGLLLLLAGVLLIGDFRVVLANSSADDSPVLFGRFIADPTRFDNDLLHTYAYIYAFGTAVHWVPALLYRVLHFPLEISAYVIALLQTVLLGLALFSLALTVTNDKLTSWLTVCFGLAAEVYSWNLANYASQMHSPYAGHLVLPLLLFGFNAWLRGSAKRSALWFGIAALVHPTLTLLALGLLIGRTLWRGPGERGWRGVTLLLIPLLLAMAPPLLLQARYGGDLAPSIVAELMRVNMHMNPFRLQRWYTTLLPVVAGYLCLVALAHWRAQAPATYRALVLDIVLYTTLLGLAHFIAVRAHLSLIMTLVPLRFVSVMIVFALPLVVRYLADSLSADALARRWASALLLILPPLGGIGALPGAVAACALAEMSADKGRPWRTMATIVFGAWVGVLLIAFWVPNLPTGVSARIFAVALPGSLMPRLTFAAGLTLAGLVALLGAAKEEGRARALLIVTAIAAGLLLMNNTGKGLRTLSGEQRDLYDAQVWAREHTDRRAIFLVEPVTAWRVGSDRPVVEATAPPLQVYSHSSEAQKMMEERLAELSHKRWVNEANILDFANRFGGDYLVRYALRPPVFQPVYRNETFAIYKLPDRATTQ
jgi:hypothetical protein